MRNFLIVVLFIVACILVVGVDFCVKNIVSYSNEYVCASLDLAIENNSSSDVVRGEVDVFLEKRNNLVFQLFLFVRVLEFAVVILMLIVCFFLRGVFRKSSPS